MAAAGLGEETPGELAVKTDFRANIWTVFQELYEDKWNAGASVPLSILAGP